MGLVRLRYRFLKKIFLLTDWKVSYAELPAKSIVAVQKVLI